uniref:Protein broad-minded n=3 Tax=Zeugodacus cucurbitae TaxID=28588 RepID=A0A0A1WG00_ZEUCU
MYCQTKAPNMSTVLTEAYNEMCESIKVETTVKGIHRDPLGVPVYAEVVPSPHVQLHGQQSTASAAFLWHKALPVANTSSITANAAMQYRKLKSNMPSNGCFMNSS